MLGFIPALKMHLRLALLSKPASRLRVEPLRTSPASAATRLRSLIPSGSKAMSDSLIGAIVNGDRTYP